MSDIWDHQFNYEAVLEAAGYDAKAGDAPDIDEILKRLRHVITVVREATIGGLPSYLRANDDGTFTIVVRYGLRNIKYAKRHETSEWQLRKYNCFDPYFERAVDELSTYFAAPPELLKVVYRHLLSGDFARLAWAFRISVFEAARRVSESTGLPIAAVRPGEILVGGEPYDWGSEATIRDIASQVRQGKWRHHELRGLEAIDDKRLVILWVDR